MELTCSTSLPGGNLVDGLPPDAHVLGEEYRRSRSGRRGRKIIMYYLATSDREMLEILLSDPRAALCPPGNGGVLEFCKAACQSICCARSWWQTRFGIRHQNSRKHLFCLVVLLVFSLVCFTRPPSGNQVDGLPLAASTKEDLLRDS